MLITQLMPYSPRPYLISWSAVSIPYMPVYSVMVIYGQRVQWLIKQVGQCKQNQLLMSQPFCIPYIIIMLSFMAISEGPYGILWLYAISQSRNIIYRLYEMPAHFGQYCRNHGQHTTSIQGRKVYIAKKWWNMAMITPKLYKRRTKLKDHLKVFLIMVNLYGILQSTWSITPKLEGMDRTNEGISCNMHLKCVTIFLQIKRLGFWQEMVITLMTNIGKISILKHDKCIRTTRVVSEPSVRRAADPHVLWPCHLPQSSHFVYSEKGWEVYYW